MELVSKQNPRVRHLSKLSSIKFTYWMLSDIVVKCICCSVKWQIEWVSIAYKSVAFSVWAPPERLAAIREMPITMCHCFICIILVFRGHPATPKANLLLPESQYFTITLSFSWNNILKEYFVSAVCFYVDVYCYSLLGIPSARLIHTGMFTFKHLF